MNVGFCVGNIVGISVGWIVGIFVGSSVGSGLGRLRYLLGVRVGKFVVSDG